MILTQILLTANALASACCSGAQSIPAFITSDDRALFGISSSYSKVVGDAPETGIPIFRDSDSQQVNLTHKVEGAYLISDQSQVGLLIPVQQRQLKNKSYRSALGELQASSAYEFLPERTYSPWKPRGFAYFGAILPTGKSIYESDQSQGIYSTGRGFYTLTLGNFWLKKWNTFDANFLVQGSYSFSRTFEDFEGNQIRVRPGISTSVALGIGASWRDFHFGFRVQPNFFQRKKIIQNSFTTMSASEMYWDTSALLSYLPKEYFTVSLGYTDQTLLGPARNTTLSRTASLSFQYLWGL